MIHKKLQSGFSLIEMVVYVSIFAMLAVVVINSYMVIVASFNRTQTNRDLQESGNAVMERISREIRQAKSITVANSTLGTTPGTLEMATTDASGTSATVKFILESGGVNIYSNGTLIGNLVGQNVTATSLIFRQMTTTAGTGVKVELTLQDARGKEHRTENFYDTVILRGDY